MGHYVGQFHLIPNSIVGGVSYNKLSESDKLKANLDMANRQILQDEIRKGYVANLIASERQTQAVLDVAKGQHEMTSAINDMAAGLDIRMAAINEQISFVNAGIEGLSNLIRIPNSEKTRIFNITEGMRYLEMAFKNPKRYEDALEFLIKAGEANHRDYIINLEIAKIYLYNSSTFDNIKAIDYLIKALEYCELDNPEIGAKVAQHLAFAYYLIADFESAIEMGDLSYDLDNKVLEGKYIAGECRFLLGNYEDGENDIFTVCSADKSYLPQVLNNKNITLPNPEGLKDIVEHCESERIVKNEENVGKSEEYMNLLAKAGEMIGDDNFYTFSHTDVVGKKSITYSMIKSYLEKVIAQRTYIKNRVLNGTYPKFSEEEFMVHEMFDNIKSNRKDNKTESNTYNYNSILETQQSLHNAENEANLLGIIKIGVVILAIWLLYIFS